MVPASIFSLICHLCVLLCVMEQVCEAVELAVFCEGFFLQKMVDLLDCEQFEELLLGSDCSTTLDPDALDGLQATLASRLHSLCGPRRAWAHEENHWKLQMWLRCCWKTWLTKLWYAGRRVTSHTNTVFRCLLTFVIPILSQWQWFNGMCELFITF